MFNYQNISVDNEKWELDTTSTAEKSLQLFVTNRCNLACNNCFSQDLTAEQKKGMSVDDAIALAEMNPDYSRVNLMGGEPLLHEGINEIVSGIKELGDRRLAIFTNAMALKRLKRESEPVRLSVSFHDLESKERNRKPIVPILDELKDFHDRENDVKPIFLIDQSNYNNVKNIITFFDQSVPWVNTLRIGLMRNEAQYFSDSGVVSFEDYAKVVQDIVNTYNGRLNFEFLTKGVLRFNDREYDDCSVDRLRNVFPDMTYSDCVLGSQSRKPVDSNLILPPTHDTCIHTKKNHCLIYKARLNQRER